MLTVIAMEQTCNWPGALFLTPVMSQADEDMEQMTKMTAVPALPVPSVTCRVSAHASFKKTRKEHDLLLFI